MPRKNNPVEALKKLREQRDELATREANLRDEAAFVLGHLLIECGAEIIEPLAGEAISPSTMPAQKVRHPRNVRILPRSRDFH